MPKEYNGQKKKNMKGHTMANKILRRKLNIEITRILLRKDKQILLH
jgi:hypothetical protein